MVTKTFTRRALSSFISIYPNLLAPWFITGYTDGEGSFSIRFRRSVKGLLGIKVSLVYSICAQVNPANLNLLRSVQAFFNGIGSISKSGDMYIYEVSSLKTLIFIRKHFEAYPLQSTKYIHFILWCRVMDIMLSKGHLTLKGLVEIISIKALFPKGIPSHLAPYAYPMEKPHFVNSTSPLDPN